jgi:hypothetical protein
MQAVTREWLPEPANGTPFCPGLLTASTTLAQKYKDKPLFNAIRALCHETLDRMEMPAEEVKIDVSLLDGLNVMLRRIFVKASAKSKTQAKNPQPV